MTHNIADRSTWRPSPDGYSPPRERIVMLAKFNRHRFVLRAETRQARGLRCQRWRGQANEKVPRTEQISSILAPTLFAIPAPDLHTSTQKRRRRDLHTSTQKRRRSERSTCQTSGLSFSALRAPNGRLFRASRSKAPEDTETAMHVQPTTCDYSPTAPPEVRP